MKKRKANLSIQATHPKLFEKLDDLFKKEDPLNLSSKGYTEPYDLQVSTIIPKLSSAKNETEVLTVIYDEFINWHDEASVAPKERFQKVAKETWKIYRGMLLT